MITNTRCLSKRKKQEVERQQFLDFFPLLLQNMKAKTKIRKKILSM